MLTGKKHTVQEGMLLAQLREGSNDAFDRLYEKYWKDVVDEAFKRLGDKDDAKDTAQEVFTSLWIRKSEVPIHNFPGWLYTVTKNQVFQRIQKQGRYVEIPDILSELKTCDSHADSAVLEKELSSSYEALIASLPKQQRVIFKMRYQDDLFPDEIALKLDLTSKTVRNHLGRALVKVKAMLMLFQFLIYFAVK